MTGELRVVEGETRFPMLLVYPVGASYRTFDAA